MSNPSGVHPVEYNVVVQLDAVEETTAGGIILPQTKRDRDDLANEEGMLVAVSPLAFSYDAWPDGSRKPEVGDRVLFARYAGALHERGGHKFRILKDKDIVAIVEPEAPKGVNPADLAARIHTAQHAPVE